MRNIETLIFILPLFTPPFALDYVVGITSCFFLQSIYARFQMLNNVWKCVPTDLVAVSGKWTHNEIVYVMENTRLLHSELCELLKMFTQSYGLMLLGFYSSSFINIIICVYFIINNHTLSSSSTRKVLEQIMILIFQVQIVMFLLSIIVFASWINDKVIHSACFLLYPIFYIFFFIHTLLINFKLFLIYTSVYSITYSKIVLSNSIRKKVQKYIV